MTISHEKDKQTSVVEFKTRLLRKFSLKYGIRRIVGVSRMVDLRRGLCSSFVV